MNLSRISDESRHDDDQAQREMLRVPDCECLADAELCPDCRDKLARYDLLRQRHRRLTHTIAITLGCYGRPDVSGSQGKLRAVLTEDGLPELPDWGDRFWQMMAGLVSERIEKEG